MTVMWRQNVTEESDVIASSIGLTDYVTIWMVKNVIPQSSFNIPMYEIHILIAFVFCFCFVNHLLELCLIANVVESLNYFW